MAFCSNCGKPMEDHMQYCLSCGARRTDNANAASPTPVPPPPNFGATPPTPPPGYGTPRPAVKASRWDGGVLDTVLHSILASLLISVTCGIATPWALCYLWGFIVDHVVIDGRRLKFSGTGGSLFGNWIVWFLLTFITCGIYGFWVAPKLYDWVASNTHFV